jgi:hypothetical protein
LVQLRQQGWQLYKSAALYSLENSLVLILLEAAVDPGTTECRWIETGQLTISNDATRNQTWNFPSHDTVCSTLGVKKLIRKIILVNIQEML